VRAHCPPRRWPRSASVTSPAEVATGGGGRAGGTAPAAGSRVACRLPSGPGGATRPGGANRTKRRGASRRLLSLPRAGGQPGGEHIGTWYAVEACPGPSWGRETADNNGQPRCPTDNQTCSSSAVMRRDGAADPYMACKGSGVQIPSAPPGTRRGGGGGSRGYRWSTVQVRVRVTPSTAWMRVTTPTSVWMST
jgi:hypothetical protein